MGSPRFPRRAFRLLSGRADVLPTNRPAYRHYSAGAAIRSARTAPAEGRPLGLITAPHLGLQDGIGDSGGIDGIIPGSQAH